MVLVWECSVPAENKTSDPTALNLYACLSSASSMASTTAGPAHPPALLVSLGYDKILTILILISWTMF